MLLWAPPGLLEELPH